MKIPYLIGSLLIVFLSVVTLADDASTPGTSPLFMAKVRNRKNTMDYIDDQGLTAGPPLEVRDVTATEQPAARLSHSTCPSSRASS